MSTTAITVSPFSRDSRNADVQIPGYASPFRSKSLGRRINGADQMIDKRLAEIAAVEEALTVSMPRRDRNRLTMRLRALKANMSSWCDYVGDADGPWREKRAVVVPTA